jgi:tetratricopeptide (TPR) repeat protein
MHFWAAADLRNGVAIHLRQGALPSVLAELAGGAGPVGLDKLGDLEQARLQTERAIDAIPRHPIANFPAYVLIQRGLLAWAEGQREAALQLMRQALHVDPANRNAQIYISWLQHLNSGAPGQFDPASLSGYSNRSAVIPALMASVFLQEPLARQFQRAPLR